MNQFPDNAHSTPIVSDIIPTYNRCVVRRAIDSGMAQAMIRLAQEPELAAKMGRAGRRRVEEHFTMDKSIGNLWQIIQSAIDDQGQAHAAR